MASLNSFMASLNSISQQSETQKIFSEGIINSNSELSQWLIENNVSPKSIARHMVSFMARIPSQTPVKLMEKNGNLILTVGNSMMKISESIEEGFSHAKGIVSKFHNKALSVLDSGKLLETSHHGQLPSGHHAMIGASHQQALMAA